MESTSSGRPPSLSFPDTDHARHNFEEYARHWPEPIRRCGGELIGYFLPTKSAGPTNVALALIEFPSVAAHEEYREALMADNEARENLARADQSACIISEERSFLQRIPS
ncbi:MAG: NIPSNAP family protein [Bryobacteraceae bacterium]